MHYCILTTYLKPIRLPADGKPRILFTVPVHAQFVANVGQVTINSVHVICPLLDSSLESCKTEVNVAD